MTPISTSDFDELITAELCEYQSRLERGEEVSEGSQISVDLPVEIQERLRAYQRCLNALHEASQEQIPTKSATLVSEYTVPVKIARYEITGKPKVGGFSLVIPAHDPLTDREVAVKVPKPEYLGSADHIDRFLQEAQSIAHVEHPNVVSVFDCGCYCQAPYLVMPWISGITLAEWRKGEWEVSPRVAAEIVHQLAEGVAAAHLHKILHRDIKPGNILMVPKTENEADPFSYQPKLVDFGLAKVLETNQPTTQTGTILGTLGYMSPEQAVGNPGAMGYATDIYSLGAVLFFLITGEAPFANAEGRPTVPYSLHNGLPSFRARGWKVPHDLEVICQKCLEQSPSQRYASAKLLAEDLKRFLNGEPIHAQPISAIRKLGKWCRRHPAWATLWIVSLLSLLSLTSVSLWYNDRLTDQLQISEIARHTAEQQEQAIRRRAYVADMALASRAWNDGNIAQTLNLLDRYRPKPGEPDQRDFAWHFLWRQYDESSKVLGHHEGGATSVAMTTDGVWGASGGEDGQIRIWSLTDGKLQHEFPAHHQKPVFGMSFSPNGKSLATAGHDGTVCLWGVPSGELKYEITKHEGHVNHVAFSPDGHFLASGGGDMLIHLWAVETGKLQGTFTGHKNFIQKFSFHPDGQRLFSTSRDGTVRIWDVETQTPHQSVAEGVLYRAQTSWPRSLAIHPDGSEVAFSIHAHGVIRLSLKAETLGQSLPISQTLASPSDNVRALIWPQNRMLVAGTISIIVEDANSAITVSLQGHADSIFGLAGTMEGKQFLSASADGDVRLWSLMPTDHRLLWGHNDTSVQRSFSTKFLGISVGENSAARQCDDGKIRLIELKTGILQSIIDPSVSADGVFQVTAHNQYLLDPTLENQMLCFSVATGEKLWGVELPARESYQYQAHHLAADQNEEFLAASCQTDVVLFRLKTGQELRRLPHPQPVQEILFLNEPGQPTILISACRDGYVRCWNVETGECLREKFAHRSGTVRLAVSADGTLLASGGNDRTVRVWKVDDLSEVVTLFRGTETRRLGFLGPDNYLLCGDASSLSLWSLDGPTERMQFPRDCIPSTFSVSPDGKTLALEKGPMIELIRTDDP